MNGETKKAEFDGSEGRLAAALEMPAGPPRAYALFAHCFSCSKDIKAAREIARALRAEGIAVLRFDFTGLGASEGDFSNTNFSSNVEDLVRAADFLRREFEAPQILIGHSLGGAAAIVAAGRISDVRAVATIGAPAEAAHVLAQLGTKRAEIEASGVAEVSLAGRAFTIRRQFLEDLEKQAVTESAAQLGKPILILHAPRDATVGVDNAARIFAAAKHPKSFVSLDTADHLLSDTADARYAASVIAAWAGRYVGGEAPAPAPSPAPSSAARHAPRVPGGAGALLSPDHPLAVEVDIDGFRFVIDAGGAEGGEGLGPNPTRVAEAALAACSAMTMKLYANRKGWPLTHAEVEVRRAAGADAHAAMALTKTVRLEGDLDAEQRARVFEIAGKCPVHRMFAGPVAIAADLVPKA